VEVETHGKAVTQKPGQKQKLKEQVHSVLKHVQSNVEVEAQEIDSVGS